MKGKSCMDFKGKGEISTLRVCKKDTGESDPVIEESVMLQFKAEEYAELVEWTNEEMRNFFKQNKKGFEEDAGSFILSNIFNMKLDNHHKLTGEEFTSCVIKKIDKAVPVIQLKCRLKFTEKLHKALPSLLNTLIDIEIKSVNEQLKIPDKNEGGE